MTALEPPMTRPGQRVLSGPERVRSELCWIVELEDGSKAALSQLLPELAADEALRRRYVYDAERRASLEVDGIAEVLEIGPKPDPRDPAAPPPWRLRREPDGERLATILETRAPLPVDEAIELVANIADVASAVHRQGVVLRDLEPRNIVVRQNGGDWIAGASVTLTDIGLARVDILSTRTASSLMLEGSAYAAPEHLRATVLDLRADLYTLGVILWQALTGELPYADTGAFFRDLAELPTFASLNIDAPEGLRELIESCLADDPSRRPESARDVAAALRGETGSAPSTALALTLVVCQACGEPLRPGLRLCLRCGKQAVQFSHAEGGPLYEVHLVQAREDADFVAKLRGFFEAVGHGPVPELNFIIGDTRLYSRSERARLHKLPATLINNLSKETADRLAERLKSDGFKVKVVRTHTGTGKKKGIRALVYGGLAASIVGIGATVAGTLALGIPLMIGGGVALIAGGVRAARRKRISTPALAELRAAPAALPASDPLIARLGALLNKKLAGDVRTRLEEIALLVQRLVDRRGTGSGALDFDRLTEPALPIVSLVEREVKAIADCDAALTDLDEGKIVRAIASSEARREPRNVRVELYAGLDRLRSLEDQRGLHMERLLEASSLMRRTVNLGLGAKDEAAEDDRRLAMAMAALEG